MTPEQKRIAWIAGLAAGAAALVGGVAYAAAHASGTTNPTPAPSAPPRATNPITQGTQPPASNDQSVTVYVGQSGVSASATPGGKLTVTSSSGLFTSATVQNGAGASSAPGSNPVVNTDGTVSLVLSGQPGWLVIQGVNSASQASTTVIAIGSPSGSPSV